MKKKLQIITMSLENTYGVDVAPTTTGNVLLAYDLEISPLEMEVDMNPFVSNKFGSEAKILGAKWASVSFKVKMGPGGTPLGNVSTVPNYDPVLRSCGMARVITAGVRTDYNNIDRGEESSTMYHYIDGVLQKVVGLRGSMTWNYQAKRAPELTFTGLGLNIPMADLPLPTNPTLPTVPRPVALNKANSNLLLDTSYQAKVSSMTITQGNDVAYRNLTGVEEVIVADRNMSGQMRIEMPLNAEKDFLGPTGICTTLKTVPLSLTHGVGAGNVIYHYFPEVQLTNPKPVEESGVLMLDCNIHIIRNRMEFAFA